MRTDSKPWWRHRVAMAAVALVVIALVIGGGLLVRHQHDSNRLAVGASRQGDYAMGDGYFSGTYSFIVPGAKITVEVETGRHGSKRDDATGEFTKFKAPRGGLLVDLGWSATRFGSTDSAHLGGRNSSLRIRSKDTSVLVDRTIEPAETSSPDEEGAKVVALPGDLGDLKLEAEFGGRTQTVSLLNGRRVLGDFASLYVGGHDTRQPMPVAEPSDGDAMFSSRSKIVTGRMSRAPYVGGLGWAPRGKEWILVDGAGSSVVTALAARWSDGEHVAGYTATKAAPQVSVTANGRKPVTTLGRSVVQTKYDVTTSTRDYVFSVRTGDAVTTEVATRLSLKRQAGGDAEAPATKSLQLRERTRYPAVVDPTAGSRR